MVKSKEQTVAEDYFKFSNLSDFSNIAKLLTPTTTYSSSKTGLYLGSEEIIRMQKEFHKSYFKLNWIVNSVQEIKPGIILFDYTFNAEDKFGKLVSINGIEYVIVYGSKIVHIEIRNKDKD